MPLVRIDLLAGRPADELTRLADDVHRALVETVGIPERDRFQVITEHDAAHLRFDRSYLGIERSDEWVAVQVVLSRGRTVEAKQALYRRLAELLEQDVGLRPEDLAVVLIENDRPDWSFGRGEASYVVIPREDWR
jgi:4-oxalocrotonate tautomerase